MKFTAVGDAAIQRALTEYDGIAPVRQQIMRGDVRFFNLETTVTRDCYANYYSGGTWLRTDKRVIRSLEAFGFNLVTGANNHCLDFGHEGLLQTIDALDEMGYVHAGLGRNLREASSPRYLDTPGGRVAIIACSTLFAPGAIAGEQSRLLPGRPGINGLRVKQTLVVDGEDMETLKRIAAKTGINIGIEADIKSGYRPPLSDGIFDLGEMHFEVGEQPGLKMAIHPDDLCRMEKAIEEAAFFADYVIVSLHSHDRQFENNDLPADYIREFAHRCIDAGAHIILGHGPHLLRPFEVYRDRPIFYSLGDFILQLENCELAPEEFYAKFGLTSDYSMYELFKARTRDFTCGLQRKQVMMEAVIPYFEMEAGKLTHLDLIPIELGLGMRHSAIGLPRLSGDNAILERYAEMSALYGTAFKLGDRRATLLLS